MSNTFSFHNLTLSPNPFPSSNSSLYPINCYQSTSGAVMFISFTFTNILFFLPLHILVLFMGVRRWMNQRSVEGVTQISHSDFFTCHMVTMESIAILALVLLSYGICANSGKALVASMFVFCMIFPGETLFHCLTCVEHYLAVVHPTVYLRHRETCAVRLRNISIVCVWLTCFEGLGVAAMTYPNFPTKPFLCLLGFSLIIVLYCSLSILRILIRPGPAEVGRDRDRLDQSKQRAFRIIVAIMGVLFLRFVGFFVCFGLAGLVLVNGDLCALINFGIWLSLPSTLILPLLFLKRAGKLPCYRQSPQ